MARKRAWSVSDYVHIRGLDPWFVSTKATITLRGKVYFVHIATFDQANPASVIIKRRDLSRTVNPTIPRGTPTWEKIMTCMRSYCAENGLPLEWEAEE